MKAKFKFLLPLCLIHVATDAQIEKSPSLTLGDPAPPLLVREWIKGAPFQRFEKKKVYVLEFWATWCKPCIAAMPHLSALARQYKDNVTILGIGIKEMKTTSLDKVKAFVDSMGNQMDYHVAVDDSNRMAASWIQAAGEQNNGIPRSFVVNAQGKLAWIGHPKDLSEVLKRIVHNDWNINQSLAKRTLDKQLRELDDSLNFELMRFKAYKPSDIDMPDSALMAIKEIITKHPQLKYAPLIASHTFSALLKTDVRKAYEYGKEVLMTPSYEEPASYSIISAIEFQSDKMTLPAEIYQLAAEAYQVRIDQIPYPELADIPTDYMKMALWYWRAKTKSKAMEALQKSIEALKNNKN